MARAGDEIFNPRTGQRMVFLETGEETGGRSLWIDTYNPPTGVPEPEHVHPSQESGLEMISGLLRFSVGGEERVVSAGESITIPANTPHYFCNDGEEEAHSMQWFRPSLKTDRFFETLFGLAQDGKLNEEGLPSPLQLAVSGSFFADEVRATSPPWVIQQALFRVLAPVGKLLGYQPEHPYSNGSTEGPARREEHSRARTGSILTAILVAVATTLLLLHRRRRKR